MKEIATFAVMDALLRCDFETGVCYWKKGTTNRVCVAGTKTSNGYIRIEVNGREYGAHRVVWLLKTGAWPSKEIDHIDGDRSNNRFENLRDTDHRGNTRNAALRSDNTSGTTGVCWASHHKRWYAYISDNNGKQIVLGYFVNKDDAIAARKAAETEYGYHKNHGRITKETSI